VDAATTMETADAVEIAEVVEPARDPKIKDVIICLQ